MTARTLVSAPNIVLGLVVVGAVFASVWARAERAEAFGPVVSIVG